MAFVRESLAIMAYLLVIYPPFFFSELDIYILKNTSTPLGVCMIIDM